MPRRKGYSIWFNQHSDEVEYCTDEPSFYDEEFASRIDSPTECYYNYVISTKQWFRNELQLSPYNDIGRESYCFIWSKISENAVPEDLRLYLLLIGE